MSKPTVTNFKRGLKLEHSYNFVDKALIIDKLHTALDDAGFTVAATANRSGVCTKTLYAWFGGKTKRPQVPTLNAVGRLVGLELQWVRK